MDWATVPARMRSALFQLEEEAEEGHLDVVLMPALEIHQNPHSTRIHKMAAGQSPPQDALGAGTMSRCEKGPFPVIIVVFFFEDAENDTYPAGCCSRRSLWWSSKANSTFDEIELG